MRAIREALNWSGRTAASAAAVAIPSRAELSQMEDEQITRIKKERRRGGREGGRGCGNKGVCLSGINGRIAQISDSLDPARTR